MMQQIKDKIKEMIKKYNEQCDVINELQNERKFYKKELLL
jgi:flagellar capping protein FliD